MKAARELRAPPAPFRPPPPPSTASLRAAAPGVTTRDMKAKVAASKAASADIEEMMRALKGAARGQKQRGTMQNHQRDWRKTNADLQKQRTDCENTRALWLQAEAALPAAQAAGILLRELAHGEAAADAARREWSVEMGSQLRDLRELCAASAEQQKQQPRKPGESPAQPPPPPPSSSRPASRPLSAPAGLGRSLLSEVSRSLAVQAERLSATATTLERELAVHTANILADEKADERGGGSGSSIGGAAGRARGGVGGGSAASEEAVEALFASSLYAAGAVASPQGQARSEGERKLLEALGMQLKSEAEAHREALESLRAEFRDSFEAAAGGQGDEEQDGDGAEEGEGGGGEGGGGEGGEGGGAR